VHLVGFIIRIYAKTLDITKWVAIYYLCAAVPHYTA